MRAVFRYARSKARNWMRWLGAYIVLSGCFLAYLFLPPQIEYPASPSAPSPNAADFYQQALKVSVDYNPPVDALDDHMVYRTPAQQAQFYSQARREYWVKANQRTWQLLQQALKTPCLSPNVDLPQNRNYFSNINRLLIFLCIKANTLAGRGDWKGSADDLLDSIEISFDTARGGQDTGHDYQAFEVSRALRLLRRTLPHLTRSQIQSLLLRLAQLEKTRPTFASILTESKWRYMGYVDHGIKNGQNWQHFYNQPSSGLGMGEFKWFFVSKRQMVRAFTDVWDEEIDKSQQLPGRSRVTSPPEYLQDLGFRFSQLRVDEANILTNLHAVRIELALNAFHLQHGRFPKNLSDIKRYFPGGLPVDPYSPQGRNLGYRPTATGYQLWTVGPDGVDDKGRMIAGSKRPNSLSDMGDFVMSSK